MKNGFSRILLALVVLAMLGVAGWHFATRWAPSRGDYPVQGIDLSEAQGNVHWPTAKADGVDFAYLRATYGAAGRDARFATHWQDAAAAGLRRGAYHQFSLCQRANDQADNFVAAVPRDEAALRPAILLDFDDQCAARPDRDSVIAEIRLLIKAMEQQTGKPVVLILSSAFEGRYRVSEAIRRDLWLRHGLFPPDFGVRTWLMWRATSIRRVNGIDQPVGWSVLYPR